MQAKSRQKKRTWNFMVVLWFAAQKQIKWKQNIGGRDFTHSPHPPWKKFGCLCCFFHHKNPLCSCEGKRLCLRPWVKMLTSLFGFQLCAAVSPLNVDLQTFSTLFTLLRGHSNIMIIKGRRNIKITCLLNVQRNIPAHIQCFLRCTSLSSSTPVHALPLLSPNINYTHSSCDMSSQSFTTTE